MKKILKSIIRAIVRTAIYIYCKLIYRAKVVGKENIPKNEPLIFCGNHKSLLDPPLMVSTAGRHLRPLGKEELKKNPFMKFLAWAFDGIYVKRDSKDVIALKTVLKALKNGESIMLFPEGTRNGIKKGEKVKDGAAFFTLRTGAKVIPVGIKGGDKTFQKVTIHYGKPLDFSKYKEVKQDDEIMSQVTNEIMENIISLTK